MGKRVIVIGGGIIGASVAWHLARRGAEVTVLSAGPGPASGATFGWINASFYLDEAHFRLRQAGMAAWHRLEAVAGQGLVDWCGCLNWEEPDPAETARRLSGLGYAIRQLPGTELRVREPRLAGLSDTALHAPEEGIVEGAEAVARLLAGSGGVVLSGVKVSALLAEKGRVSAIDTNAGRFEADHVVLAAGTETAALLAPLGIELPMLQRPGMVLRTRPVEKVLSHIIVAPGQELRQDAAGRLVASTVGKHQEDRADRIAERPDLAAEATLARIAALLPGVDLELESVTLANRPMPADERPVIGAVGPEGLTVAVMHSGVTLAAILGELVAAEVMTGADDPLLRPYRPSRLIA
ncbi:fructosyl-amino acid oxidase, putative [Oceanicola granulosus HTCC2516]|uniref:Fructosyl-amino acid oxidase, putative n=1 Tax=Oceanicola granulosus (strain ATCC BAA-861 / DSM 15982 / KCTC 12143 / HTCC2516) TaxID=314256 RepID=Q2CG62_OCEGH|nr:FAD-dependent oxidoreductase [Oceanicola granulosus]EAR51667.1 fructosyl-amino acid oxidase, putative [Oceanicola granulosus HTCC2516]